MMMMMKPTKMPTIPSPQVIPVNTKYLCNACIVTQMRLSSMECSEQKSNKKKLLQDPGPKRKDTWDVQAFVALKIVTTEHRNAKY